MELKLPISFFLLISCIVIWLNPHVTFQAEAFTVCDLLSSNNVTASEIQQAVDNGSIQYSDLPGAYQVNIHAQGDTISQPTKAITDNSMPCDQSNNKSWNVGPIISVISLLIFPIFIIKILHADNRLKRIGFAMIGTGIIILGILLSGIVIKDMDGEIGAAIISSSCLFGIGIAFYVRGRQQEDQQIDNEIERLHKERFGNMFDKEDNHDMTTIEDNVATDPNSLIRQKPRTINYNGKRYKLNPKLNEPKHPFLARILLAIGLIRVKKK